MLCQVLGSQQRGSKTAPPLLLPPSPCSAWRSSAARSCRRRAWCLNPLSTPPDRHTQRAYRLFLPLWVCLDGVERGGAGSLPVSRQQLRWALVLALLRGQVGGGVATGGQLGASVPPAACLLGALCVSELLREPRPTPRFHPRLQRPSPPIPAVCRVPPPCPCTARKTTTLPSGPVWALSWGTTLLPRQAPPPLRPALCVMPPQGSTLRQTSCCLSPPRSCRHPLWMPLTWTRCGQDVRPRVSRLPPPPRHARSHSSSRTTSWRDAATACLP